MTHPIPIATPALALRIGRGCRMICPRPWGSTCIWCNLPICPNEDRGFVPLVGAVHVDCIVEAIAVADEHIRATT